MKLAEKVSKRVSVDPSKVEIVRKIIHAATDMEAIDMALDLIIANDRIEKALASIKGKGDIKDAFGRVSV